MGLLDKIGNFIQLAKNDPDKAKEKIERKAEKTLDEVTIMAHNAKKEIKMTGLEIEKQASQVANDFADHVGLEKPKEDASFGEKVLTHLGNGLKVAIGLTPLGWGTSCTEFNPPYVDTKFSTETSTNFTNTKTTTITVTRPKDTKETAEYRLNELENDKAGKYHHETADGVHYTYGVDTETYDKPFVTLDDGTILPIDYKSLTKEIGAETVVNYIKNLGDELNNKDGLKYEFVVNNDKPAIVIHGPNGDVTLPLDKEINGKNVVDYINSLGEDKPYKFRMDGNNPTVDFENGFTHKVGDDVTIKPESTYAAAADLLTKVGLMEKNDNELLTNLKTNDGSYGNQKPGVELEVVPGDVTQVIANPNVKGHIGEIEFEGPMTKDGNDVIIKNKNGDEIRLSYKEGYDVGDGEEPDEYDGVLVSVNGQEAYILSKFDDTTTDIGKIDRKRGTTVQHYPHTNTSFDLKLPKEADDYYNGKLTILTETKTDAKTYYDEKYNNLDEARFDANEDYYGIKVPPNVDNRTETVTEEHVVRVKTSGSVTIR